MLILLNFSKDITFTIDSLKAILNSSSNTTESDIADSIFSVSTVTSFELYLPISIN